MSSETVFKAGAWVGGHEYTDEERLKNEIGRAEENIGFYREKLLALAVSTPQDIMADIIEDNGNPLDEIMLLFDELWEGMQDEVFRLANLCVIENNIDYIDNGED